MFGFLSTIFETNEHKFKKILDHISSNIDCKELHKMLSNFDIDTCDKNGKNLMHLLASMKNPTLLQLLFDHGININQPDNRGQTPLFYTNTYNYLFFASHGADLRWRNKDGHSFLHLLSNFYGSKEALALITVGKDCGLNLIDYSEYPPEEVFQRAIVFRDMEKMKEMLAENKNYSNQPIKTNCSWVISPNPITPLYVACYNAFYDGLELLIAYGADPQEPQLLLGLIRYVYKPTAFFVRIIERLVELGADIHETSTQNEYDPLSGETVLHRCSRSLELMELFLKAGCDVHKRTKRIRESNSFYQVSFSAPNRCIVDRCMSDADPLQYAAVSCKDIRIFKLLFEHGADPNRQNSYGICAFMTLCYCSVILREFTLELLCDIVQLFLDQGVNIYLTDNNGNTVFDYLYANNFMNLTEKANIVKLIHKKEKFLILEPKTNEIIYKMLGKI